jgi:hypothetical protein
MAIIVKQKKKTTYQAAVAHIKPSEFCECSIKDKLKSRQLAF